MAVCSRRCPVWTDPALSYPAGPARKCLQATKGISSETDSVNEAHPTS